MQRGLAAKRRWPVVVAWSGEGTMTRRARPNPREVEPYESAVLSFVRKPPSTPGGPMDYDPEPTSSSRQYFLGTLLALLAASGFFVFLVAITGGFFLYVLAAVVAIAGFACAHYLLW